MKHVSLYRSPRHDKFFFSRAGNDISFVFITRCISSTMAWKIKSRTPVIVIQSTSIETRTIVRKARETEFPGEKEDHLRNFKAIRVHRNVKHNRTLALSSNDWVDYREGSWPRSVNSSRCNRIIRCVTREHGCTDWLERDGTEEPILLFLAKNVAEFLINHYRNGRVSGVFWGATSLFANLSTLLPY